MDQYRQINVQEAQKLIAESNGIVIDIRDPMSFQEEHISNAIQLSDQDIAQFISQTPKDKSLIFYCYHGFSSQSAAAYFFDQGFKNVYSLEGGFEEWRKLNDKVRN